jgi:hypothetical protein
MKALENTRQLAGRDARPGILDDQLHQRPARRQRDLDLTFEGKLERVREQVQNDLFPLLSVDIHLAR